MKNIENKLIEILLEENSKEDLIRKILDFNNLIKDDNKVYKVGDVGPAGGIVFMTHDDGTCVECWIEDEPNLMTWREARERVQTLNYGGSNDWVLPTIDELNKMYGNKKIIDNFQHNYYWSDTEYNKLSAWLHYFKFGDQKFSENFYYFRVRAIRRFKV